MKHSCGNCKYVNESENGEHCNGCKQNATDKFEQMTNADRIRSMTDEELADFLVVFDACCMCSHNTDSFCSSKNCDEIGITKKWLQSPAEV